MTLDITALGYVATLVAAIVKLGSGLVTMKNPSARNSAIGLASAVLAGGLLALDQFAPDAFAYVALAISIATGGTFAWKGISAGTGTSPVPAAVAATQGPAPTS